MPDYLFNLQCPNCEQTIGIHFGRRQDDTSVIKWIHINCPVYLQRRVDDVDYFTTSLPTDESGNLIPPQ